MLAVSAALLTVAPARGRQHGDDRDQP
jgi:hypothetical protein